MEYLYRTVIPQGSVHCMAWSGLNLIALSVSVEIEGYVENNERYVQLAGFQLHCTSKRGVYLYADH